MSRKSLVAVVWVVGLIAFSSRASFGADSRSALEALRNLPRAYQHGVVWMSADNADPHPDRWYVSARNADRGGVVMNLTIAGGRVISERPTLSPRAWVRSGSPMDISEIQVDSTDLWRMAQEFSDDRGSRLGSLSVQLQQNGRHATPTWSVWCYDRRGGYIGFFSALATTGTITARR